LKAYHSIQRWFPFIFGCSKNRYIHCKTLFTCWVSQFCNGFTLGATAQATLVADEVCLVTQHDSCCNTFFGVKFEKKKYTIINLFRSIGNIIGFIFYIGGRTPYVIFFFPFQKIKIILKYFKRFFIFLNSKNKYLKKKK